MKKWNSHISLIFFMCVGSTTGETSIYFVYMKMPFNLHEENSKENIFFSILIDCIMKKKNRIVLNHLNFSIFSHWQSVIDYKIGMQTTMFFIWLKRWTWRCNYFFLDASSIVFKRYTNRDYNTDLAIRHGVYFLGG